MKNYVFALVCFTLLSNCKKDIDSKVITTELSEMETNLKSDSNCPEYLLKNKNSNLNISILLDLSSRIEEGDQYLDDIEYLKIIADEFTMNIGNEKTILIKDKIQLFFDPIPKNREIRNIADKLKFSLSRDNISKGVLSTINTDFSSQPKILYETAIKDAQTNNGYPGSDTWRFFKDKIEDYSIDLCYRNILVILTDGYMYYDNTVFNEDNMTSYILPNRFPKDLTKSNWESIIKEKNYGFIPANTNLDNLEVLVLGIKNQNKNNPYTIDILKKYWVDWLEIMGVKNYKIKEADIPSNMENVIRDFI